MADPSMVRAARSSGSRLWTSLLPRRAGEQRYLHGHGVDVVGHSFRRRVGVKPLGQLRVLGRDAHGALAGVAMVALPGGYTDFIDEIRFGNLPVTVKSDQGSNADGNGVGS